MCKQLERFKCVNCEVDTSGKTGFGEYYMLRQPIWDQTGLFADSGMLCIPCVEKKLGRKLNHTDFRHCPLNDALVKGIQPCSELLADRLKGFEYSQETREKQIEKGIH